MNFIVLRHRGQSTPVVAVLNGKALATLPGEFAVGKIETAKLMQMTGELCAVFRQEFVNELLKESGKSDANQAVASMATTLFTGDALLRSAVKVENMQIEYCQRGVDLTDTDNETQQAWSSPVYVVRMRLSG